MNNWALKIRAAPLLVGSLCFALVSAFQLSGQAMDIEPNVRLVLGESTSELSPGTVVFGKFGRVRGESHAFPAISSDRQQIAILDLGDPHDPSFDLWIVEAQSRKVIDHFELVAADKRREAMDSVDRDTALKELERRIQENLQLANHYLTDREFRPLPKLYDIADLCAGDSFPRHHDQNHRVCEGEVGAWTINYDAESGELEVSLTKSGGIALYVRRPIEVYGMARPGVLCRVRPTPQAGWYDRDSNIAVIRLRYIWGGHGCDVSDKWLIESMDSS